MSLLQGDELPAIADYRPHRHLSSGAPDTSVHRQHHVSYFGITASSVSILADHLSAYLRLGRSQDRGADFRNCKSNYTRSILAGLRRLLPSASISRPITRPLGVSDGASTFLQLFQSCARSCDELGCPVRVQTSLVRWDGGDTMYGRAACIKSVQ